jgi:hypothetical protein
MAYVAFEANMEKAMIQIAEEIIFRMQRELRIAGKESSGKLIDSFEYTIEDNTLRIFSREKYAGAVNFGRGKTQRGGNGAVMRAIEEWMQDKGIRARKPKRDGKDRGFAPNASGGYLRAAAYAISQKIHYFGYEGVDYTGFAMDQLKDKLPEQIGLPMLEGIQEMLEKNIKNMVGTGKSKF